MIDSAPEKPRWLPALITGTAPMIGIPLGALSSGALVEFAPTPRVLIYAILGAALLACIILLILSPETRARREGAFASLRPRLHIPQKAGWLLLAAGAVFVATWSVSGYFQAFSASLVAERFHDTNPLLAAAAFASIMVLNPVGGPLSGKRPAMTALRGGAAFYMLALGCVVFALTNNMLAAFIGASLVAGIAQGVASTGAIRFLLADVAPTERAGLLSTIYLIAYSGAAIPGIIARQLTGTMDLYGIFLGYAALGAVASVVAILAAKRT